MNQIQQELVSQEISEMFSKGAVTEIQTPPEGGFFSTLFLVPKKDGGQRPVINLKNLNSFINAPHFKMEGIHALKNLLKRGDWLVKTDLKDAYFSVPISQQHRKFLCFQFKDNLYQFNFLPFGLASAPWVNEDRQHNSHCLYQQPRCDSIQGVDIPDSGPMDVVPGKEYSHSSSVPTWCNEPDSGQGVEVHEGQVGLEPGLINLPKNRHGLWTTGSGPFCVQTHQSVPPLLQLVARSICGGNRCIPPGLEDNQRLCQPTMESDPQGVNENTNAGSGCNPGSSCLENTAMVHSPAVVGSRLATPITQTDTQYGVSTHNAPTSRVEHLRKALAVKAFKDKLQSLSSTLGDQKLADHMTHYSGDGIAGVLNGVQIPFPDL